LNEFLGPTDLTRIPLQDGCEIIRIEEVTGDASTRKYYRLVLTKRSPIVLMVIDDPATDEASRFLKVQQFLLDLGIPVPRVHWSDLTAGIITLQDLGGRHLEDAVKDNDIALATGLYEKAVDILTRLQQEAKPHHRLCADFNPPFSPTKFMEEFAFFVTHYVGNLAKNRTSASALKNLSGLFDEICNEIDFSHCVLCHRDYHARNIMLHRGSPVVIDFQDARLGPAEYDLASLLRDSYVSIPQDLVNKLITRYYDSSEEIFPSFDHFRYLFDVVSLQRNIKALGTFGYQTYVRASPRYLSAIPRTCEYIQSNVRKYSRFARFASVVDDLICEPGLSICISSGK